MGRRPWFCHRKRRALALFHLLAVSDDRDLLGDEIGVRVADAVLVAVDLEVVADPDVRERCPGQVTCTTSSSFFVRPMVTSR